MWWLLIILRHDCFGGTTPWPTNRWADRTTLPFSVTVHVRVDTDKCCLCHLSQSLKGTSQSNPFSKVWWYRLFQYFEENVSGTVPRNYQLPVSLRSQQWSRGVKYSKVDTQWHPPTSTRVKGQGIWLPWVLMWPKEDGTIRCSTVFFSSLGTDTSVWVALYPTYIFFSFVFFPLLSYVSTQSTNLAFASLNCF